MSDDSVSLDELFADDEPESSVWSILGGMPQPVAASFARCLLAVFRRQPGLRRTFSLSDLACIATAARGGGGR